MHERRFEGGGFSLPLLQSEPMESTFLHGFTTRAGGVSAPPFDSLNLGGSWGDAPASVDENRRRLRAIVGVDGIHFATQVHGARVVEVSPEDSPARTSAARADAVWAPRPGVTVGVYAADCVPIVVADLATGACAAIHAGWRGTVARVLSATLERMLRAPGASVDNLRLAIGPSIGPCCFEVGPEVIEAVEASYPGARGLGAIRGGEPRGARPHVDLWALNVRAARELGFSMTQIDVAGACTVCHPERFFSYRRARGRTGQSVAFIRAREGAFLDGRATRLKLSGQSVDAGRESKDGLARGTSRVELGVTREDRAAGRWQARGARGVGVGGEVEGNGVGRGGACWRAGGRHERSKRGGGAGTGRSGGVSPKAFSRSGESLIASGDAGGNEVSRSCRCTTVSHRIAADD